jgi:hypothetical protein
VAFRIPYVYNYITKLCRTQAEISLNHVNPNVHGIGQGEAMNRNCKRLRPSAVQLTNCSFSVVK